MRKVVIVLAVLVCSFAVYGQQVTEGSLFASDAKGNELGACPLKTTAVTADISGFIARVTVRQEFENKFATPIEAVYVFPLSQNGAVDRMTMTVGERVINGKIMKREEARKVYETAKAEGKTAGLLDQERANIFTQSVANIMPGQGVVVEISYVETLKYEDGAYEFVFPMTVGPRYNPASVVDAAKISPPVTATRAGHDISITVNLNAGVPVEEVRSTSHEIATITKTASESQVTLKNEKVIPNKDFILRYDVTGKRIEDAVLAHRDPRGGFFTLMLQPPDGFVTEDRTPKEIVFVLDTSGSMSGFPIEKAKEAMKLSLDGLYPDDTFNLITFAGDTAVLFDKPVPATQTNLEKAQQFLAGRTGGGGTEMMKAIKAALDPSDAQDHLRIVCFMTDGMVGNEDQIIAEVQRHPNARVFSFGIGSSVNRLLLDKIAQEGKGEATYVALEDDGSKAAKKFHERVRTPLLTDISIDWNGLPVADIYPGRLTDLFSAKPVIVHGRYTKAASGSIKLRGKVAGQPYEREIKIDLPDSEAANDVLASLWARTRIDEVSSQRLKAAAAKDQSELDRQVLELGLEFGLMTKFTSFVAVEDRIANPGGNPATVKVPNELPAGMDPSNATSKVYSKWNSNDVAYIITAEEKKAYSNGTGSDSGNGTGTGYGYGSGSGGGGGGGKARVVSQGVLNASSVAATVNVTADASDEQISTNITSQTIQSLPAGTSFSNVLRVAPSVSAKSLGGGFWLDGASGSENTFVIDGQELANYRTGVLNKKALPTRKEMPLEGNVKLLVLPEFPKMPNGSTDEGRIVVDIETDAQGRVVKAAVVSGPERFREEALKAANATLFSPLEIDGKPARLGATLVYDLKKDRTVDSGIKNPRPLAATDAEMRTFAASAKLHAWIYAIVTRLRDGVNEPTPNEAMFVANGKAKVRVTLEKDGEGMRTKLAETGLEIIDLKGRSATGRIAIEKLTELAALSNVKLVVPEL